jgi:monoamine oxidase
VSGTRRDFLVRSAAFVALPLAQQLDPFVRRASTQRVLVLGAGLAGLCTAYELQRLGHDVTVLEAQTRPGGRVRTLREPFPPGVEVEAGAESVPGAHQITQHYTRELGLSLVPFRVSGTRAFYHVRGQRIVDAEHTRWPLNLTDDERALGLGGLFAKYVDPVTAEVAKRFPAGAVEALRGIDAHTMGTWLRAQGASPAAAELVALGFGTDFGSAAAFVLHGVNSRGGGPAFRIDGGNDRLPRAFANRVTVRYGTPVVSVRQEDERVTVEVSGADGRRSLAADRIVCALPCPAIDRIFDGARLSDAKQRAIREQNYSHTAKVFLQTRTRFWLAGGWSGFVETDLPIERLTPDPGTDATARGALAAYPIGAYARVLERMDDAERVSAALAQARQIFPELGDAFEGGVSYSWATDPWQRGAFALHAPGQIGFIDTLAAREGRIHFAGEHTSVWTGWMQGALESARRVVNEING